MDIDFIREYCLSLPEATEMIQWESSLLFKVGGKIFVLYSLDEGTENLIKDSYELVFNGLPKKTKIRISNL